MVFPLGIQPATDILTPHCTSYILKCPQPPIMGHSGPRFLRALSHYMVLPTSLQYCLSSHNAPPAHLGPPTVSHKESQTSHIAPQPPPETSSSTGWQSMLQSFLSHIVSLPTLQYMICIPILLWCWNMEGFRRIYSTLVSKGFTTTDLSTCHLPLANDAILMNVSIHFCFFVTFLCLICMIYYKKLTNTSVKKKKKVRVATS